LPRVDAAHEFAPRRSLPGLPGLADWMAGLRGWRRALVALMLGALAVLALPPVHLVPVLIPSVSGLVWLLASERRRRGALLTGWWFGMGYFVAGLYWVANALLTKPELFGWLSPLAPVGLSLILAPFIAVAAWLARIAAPRPGIGLVCALAGAWTLLEWARSWVATGFPWNLVGSAWAFSDAMLQVTALVGTYGLGLLTMIAAGMPAALAAATPPQRRTAWGALALSLALLAVAWGYGLLRLQAAGSPPLVDGVWLRLVQPNIPQTLKGRRDLVAQHVADQIALGATPADRPPTHVIWSEAAAPLFLAENPRLVAAVAAHTPQGGATIIGTLRRTPADEPFQIWNSLLAIDDQGRVAASYDKSHLVPFGEYMPFRQVVTIPAVASMVDFSAGPGITTLSIPGLPPVSPLICYEVIFPGRVTEHGSRPQWLLNLTNDGWYGISAGPFQHLVTAQLRAVEEGLPLVRVANTGISAIIDPWGRVIASLDLDTAGSLDGPLPQPLAAPTLYSRTGNALPLTLALIVFCAGALFSRRR
jgi:apolipoprotein N-acyltransferase